MTSFQEINQVLLLQVKQKVWYMMISIICPGHEDGKVKLWLSQKNSLSLLTCLDTARYFTTDEIRFVENFYEENMYSKFLCIFC